jgi:hypothetical protein
MKWVLKVKTAYLAYLSDTLSKKTKHSNKKRGLSPLFLFDTNS